MTLSQTGTIPFKNRRLYTLALRGAESPFGLTGRGEGNLSISLFFVFTTQARAEAEAKRGIAGVKKPEIQVCSVDGFNLCSAITSGKLAETTGHDVIMFDGVPIPITREGAQWLSTAPTYPGSPPDPEVWERVKVPFAAWAEGARQASAETHRKVLMVRSLYIVLGEDFTGIAWKDAPLSEEVAASSLLFGFGMGKTIGGWTSGPDGEA